MHIQRSVHFWTHRWWEKIHTGDEKVNTQHLYIVTFFHLNWLSRYCQSYFILTTFEELSQKHSEEETLQWDSKIWNKWRASPSHHPSPSFSTQSPRPTHTHMHTHMHTQWAESPHFLPCSFSPPGQPSLWLVNPQIGTLRRAWFWQPFRAVPASWNHGEAEKMTITFFGEYIYI